MKEQIEKNFTYHAPKGTQPARYEVIRHNAKVLAALIDNNCPESREKDIAMTRIEEAVMWANKSIALEDK